MVRDFINCNNCNFGFRSKGVSNCLKKIGSYFGKLKNTISNFQREVSSATESLDLEKDIDKPEDKNTKKDNE